MPYATSPLALLGTRRLIAALAAVTLALFVGVGASHGPVLSLPATAPQAAPSPLTPAVERVAAEHPDRIVDVIVQGASAANRTGLSVKVSRLGGSVGRELPLINAFTARMRADAAAALALEPGVRAVSLNAPIAKTGSVDPRLLATAYNQSIRADKAWDLGYTGRGVGVAVIDTGIQGDLPSFRVSPSDHSSRVVASAVVNPMAQSGADTFGHGTHIAGLVAGNSWNRGAGDAQAGRYIGVAPDANLISVKIDDGHGAATVGDVIDGLQFVVDKRAELGIRVVNLSLRSTVAESYRTDPLDAAVEAAWNAGMVVVAAAGNEGSAPDAVNFAPANDPYIITVGAVDDQGTKDIADDELAPWSSRGTTQDGLLKPDVLAPGARMVSTIPVGSDYTHLCPQCVTDGAFFRVGGTSMAAGVASGAVAIALQAHPAWTPNEVKAYFTKRTRAVYEAASSSDVLVDATGEPEPRTTTTASTIVGGEIALDKVLNPYAAEPAPANQNLTPNMLIDPATGGIDYSRTSWSRTSWSEAADPLRTSWSRTSWSRTSWSRTSWSASGQNCADLERTSWSRTSWSAEDLASARAQCDALLAEAGECFDLAAADWSRTSWSRTSWSRTSWSHTSWSAEELEGMSDADFASAAQMHCDDLASAIEATRTSWSRTSWSRTSWSRTSWSRTSWSRTSWSRTSWSSSFDK